MDRNTLIETLENKLCTLRTDKTTGKLCLEVHLRRGGISKAVFATTVEFLAQIPREKKVLDKISQ